MNELTLVIEKSGLDEDQALALKDQFEAFQLIASEWEAKAKEIVVTDEFQTDLMAKAREGRLYIKSQRTSLEKLRKTLKERSLKEGQAIDGAARMIKALLEPIEGHLLLQEKYAEIKEDERLDELEGGRMTTLKDLDVDYMLYDLRKMPQEDFDRLVASTKEAIRLKEEEAIRLEAERIAREKKEAEELAQVRAENEKLRLETEAKEIELAKERGKKAEADRLLEAERQEKLEAQHKAKQEQHDKELALQREKYAKETKAKEKEKVLSVNEQLIIARRTLTNVHHSTDHECESCLAIRSVIDSAIKQIGGWLE